MSNQDMSRVQRRQRETRERIFRAAMTLFERNGFEQTTIADIAEAADIGKGTFFLYFPSKEAIFSHLGEMLMQIISATALQSLDSSLPAAKVLEQSLMSAAQWHEQNRALSRPVILAGLHSSAVADADTPNWQQMMEVVQMIVRTGQEQGEFRSDVRTDDAALALIGAYVATVLAWGTSQPERPLPESLLSVLSIALTGLRDTQ
ncbi:MAG: TetR/AcrR family transcriptional regulator [Anaerolineae bacterium]|nr:TetR/AcrR family transcriptional regulator [Anaerolineae bacterium]